MERLSSLLQKKKRVKGIRFRFSIDYLNTLNTALVEKATVPEVGCGEKAW